MELRVENKSLRFQALAHSLLLEDHTSDAEPYPEAEGTAHPCLCPESSGCRKPMTNTEPEATPNPICLTNQLMHVNNRSMVLCTNDSLREKKKTYYLLALKCFIDDGCARDYPKPLLIWAGLILTIILASGNYYQPHYIQRRLKHGLISFPIITIKAFVCLFLRRKIDIYTQYTYI